MPQWNSSFPTPWRNKICDLTVTGQRIACRIIDHLSVEVLPFATEHTIHLPYDTLGLCHLRSRAGLTTILTNFTTLIHSHNHQISQ